MSAATGQYAAAERSLPGRAGQLLLMAARRMRAALRSLPRAAWACALVALLNALAWSLIVPPFQVPDENAHYAYVQQVAERGTLPRPTASEGPLSPREDAVLASTLSYGTLGHRDNPAPLMDAQQRVIEAAEREHPSARGSGDALSATGNPPLYYLLQAVPYKLVASGGVLDKLAAMRVLSAVIGALTVLFIFLFLRELLPGTPWAWTAGALVAALQPLFAFMSGGVNNDDLLYLAAAGLLWALARAFHRGLTPATGAPIGLFLGAGLLTKLNMLGFIPAVALCLALLLRRAVPSGLPDALRGATCAAAIAAAPFAVYVTLNHFAWGRSAIPGGVGAVAGAPGRSFSLRQEISHIWQLFLPRVWGRAQFSYSPLWETWFKGFVGRFGWLDYGFPEWVYRFARDVWLLVAALAAGELVRRRSALRRRLGELSVYALSLVGVCVVIGVSSYRSWIANGGVFEQPRYLLPLLGLYAAIAALAVRLGGRRWGPVIGVALVGLAIGHDLFAQAITISRYYT